MFVRHLKFKLKPNAAPEVAKVTDNDIMPLLRKQKGFREALVCIAPDRHQAFGISFWDTKADAETYDRSEHKKQVDQFISKLSDGVPTLETFELATSTFQRLSAKA